MLCTSFISFLLYSTKILVRCTLSDKTQGTASRDIFWVEIIYLEQLIFAGFEKPRNHMLQMTIFD